MTGNVPVTGMQEMARFQKPTWSGCWTKLLDQGR